MKFNLIEKINDVLRMWQNEDAKKPVALNEIQMKLITLMQDQAQPELDGLMFDEISSNLDAFKKGYLQVCLKNRKSNNYILIIDGNNLTIYDCKHDKFELKLIINEDGRLTSYACNYVYGDDVINFIKIANPSLVHAQFFINADEHNTPVSLEPVSLERGVPTKLIPDFEQDFTQLPNGEYVCDGTNYEIKNSCNDNDPSEVITKWRQICNARCDIYREFRFNSLKPKSR